MPPSSSFVIPSARPRRRNGTQPRISRPAPPPEPSHWPSGYTVGTAPPSRRCCSANQIVLTGDYDKNRRKVGYLPEGKPVDHTPFSAASDVEQVIRMLEGRWKLLRFSDLERAIPAISQKMLIQQLRQ